MYGNSTSWGALYKSVVVICVRAIGYSLLNPHNDIHRFEVGRLRQWHSCAPVAEFYDLIDMSGCQTVST